MTQNNQQLSFYELLERHKVEIPMLQRDYAQGRKEHSEVLNTFLSVLKEGLINKKEIQLDFIYGNILADVFQPLDGQQRLTTLFLLHWYVAKKEKIDAASLLCKFSYETRYSSRDFCKALVENDFGYDVNLGSLSGIIIDSNWFYLSWKKDPTIQSMLNALDKIHAHFNDIGNLWDLLKKQRIITFYYVELENIGLTDDLYIKMNARGKLLTPFENFKAALQKKAIANNWENDESTESFFFLIDTKWTDYFWHNFRNENKIDNSHIRFISAIIMTQLAFGKIDEKNSLIQRINEKPEEIRPTHVDGNSFKYLFDCYEKYMNSDFTNSSHLGFPLWRHTPIKSLIDDIVNDILTPSGSSYTTKVLFYAQTQYLLKNECIDLEKYAEWMRVVRNIISRGSIDKEGKRPDIIRSPEAYVRAIVLIEELSQGCSNIYEYLNSNSIHSLFSRDQVNEEQHKSKIFKQNPEIKQLIWDIEDNELLRGRIEFVLYCIDCTDDVNIDVELLEKVKDVFCNYFNNENEISNELRRAMLCTNKDEHYSFYDYWWSRWYAINATKRKLLENFRELEYIIYSEQKEYFKCLVLQLIDKSLSEIIQDFNPPETMPNWQRQLIKNPDLLDKKKSCYIAIADDNSYCYLLKSKRPRDTEGCTKIE